MLRVALVALLALAATAPVAAADPAGCSFALWVWHADYGCHVYDAGASGTVVWCPFWSLCADDLVLACSLQQFPYWVCTSLA